VASAAEEFVMASEKGIYWLAVGVLAIGLNSTLQQQEVRLAQCVTSRASALASNLMQRGLDYAIMAEAMLGRDPADSPRLQAALGRLQAKTARAQAELARQEAQRDMLQARLDAQKMRIEFHQHSMQNFEPRVELCPEMVNVQIPDVSSEIPEVQAKVDAAMRQVKVFKSLKEMKRMQAVDALQNLPGRVDFDFSSFSNMDFPQRQVQMEIRREMRTDGEGPI
jgi:hypothetical protein